MPVMRPWMPCCLVAGLLVASPALGENLVDVYRLARQNDPVVAAYLEQQEGAREGIAQSRAALLPQVGLTADHTLVKQHTGNRDGYSISSYGLNLKIPIWHQDNWIGLRLAEKQSRQAELGYLAQEQGLVMRVTKAYLDVLSAEETLRLAKSEETAMNRQLATTQERLKVGEAVVTDVQEALAWRDLAAARTIAADHQLASSREALTEIIATPPGRLQPLKPEIPMERPGGGDQEAWVVTARSHNFDLQVAQLGVAIAQDQLEQVEAGHYPTLDAVGSHSYRDNGASPQWMGGLSQTDSLMVQLTVPLYAGGMVTSRERQSQRTLNQRQQELEQVDRQVVRQTRDSYRAVVTGIAQTKALRQAVKSAELALASTREGMQAGLRTTLDVLTSERDYHQAQRNHVLSRFQYILAALQLKQAAGTLGEEDLQRINGWLK